MLKLNLGIILAFFILLKCGVIHAQFADTVRIMSYNLMRYDAPGISCTPIPATTRNAHLKKIVFAAKPDIFAAIEVGEGSGTLATLLTSFDTLTSVGKQFVGYTILQQPSDQISATVVYNKKILTVTGVTSISGCVRSPFIYHFKYTNPQNASETHTFYVIVAHLKAGNSGPDATDRGTCATAILNYLNGTGARGNYMVMGDFNVYGSSEAGYQNFLTYSNQRIKFYDVLNLANNNQNWSNNPTFAAMHTQSPRTTDFGNCFSTGGMDDRFDFILVNASLLNDSTGMKIQSNTYKAYGNDGNRFDGTINSPTNNLVGNSVATALHDMSDHIPVMVDFKLAVATNPRLNADISTLCGTNLVIDFGSVTLCGNNITVSGSGFSTVGGINVVRCKNPSINGGTTLCGNNIVLYAPLASSTSAICGSNPFINLNNTTYCGDQFMIYGNTSNLNTINCNNSTSAGTNTYLCPGGITLVQKTTAIVNNTAEDIQINVTNPFQNNIGIEIAKGFESSTIHANIQIFDLTGQLLVKYSSDQRYISVPTLNIANTGYYLLHLEINNTFFKTYKIIKLD